MTLSSRDSKILRVAVNNGAAFEWIQHEHVGRQCGLSTEQLYVIRDTETPLPPSSGILSPLLTAALVFADASTTKVKVGKSVTDELMKQLAILARDQGQGGDGDSVEERTQDLYVEAALVVATYNMVSRFLVSADVACMSDDEVPWPLERKEVRLCFYSNKQSDEYVTNSTIYPSLLPLNRHILSMP